MEIRFARPEDAAALVEIYAPYVLETAITYEYEVPSREEFSARIESTLEKYPYLVAEENGQITGYAYAGCFKPRPAYDWMAEVSIYLRRDARGRGLGRKLYDALEDILRLQGILRLVAVVTCPDEDNEYVTRASVEFHKHMGYESVGVFRDCGYKFGRWHNTAWMEKRIAEVPGDVERVKPISQLR